MMLVQRITQDMTDAMKARDQAKLSALRIVKAAMIWLMPRMSAAAPIRQGTHQEQAAAQLEGCEV